MDDKIQSLVYDFGGCGCSGWGIECVGMSVPLDNFVHNMGIIAGNNCWCPGFPQHTQVWICLCIL